MTDNNSSGHEDTGRCSRGAVLGEAFAKIVAAGDSREGGGGFSIAILTGGESKRMGHDKAMLTLAGHPLAAHVIDAMRPLSSDLFLVGNDIEAHRHFGLPVCGDLHATRSSLVGVYSALAASRHDTCLAVSCDLPFADPELARLMLAAPGDHDAVVPVSPAGLEPLFAVYRKSCLDTMAAFIKRGDFKLINVLERLKVHWVAPADMGGLRDPSLTFFNVNTPADLARAEELLPAAGEARRGRGTRQPPLLCFVGNKDSGKTTFLEKLVAELTARGLGVACIKHDSHGFTLDREGTDTARLAAAGARRVVISSPDRFAMIAGVDREASLDELRALAGRSVDIILAEGFKHSRGDKIEVRGSADAELVCPAGELLALVSDEDPNTAALPVFGRGDPRPVAEFIIGRYGLQPLATARVPR